MPLMFLNGGAMRGGPLHHLLAGASFVGVVRTAPRYRFYSVGDRFPALAEITGPAAQDIAHAGEAQDTGDTEKTGDTKDTSDTEDTSERENKHEHAADAPAPTIAEQSRARGVAVAGELYDVPWDVLRDCLLPAEPPELELHVIELEDGTGCLSMVRRRAHVEPPGLYRDISDHADWRSYKLAAAPPVQDAL